MREGNRAGNINRVNSSAWHKSALVLSKVVLAQRTESSAKLREKIAANHGKRHSAKHRRLQDWPRLQDVKAMARGRGRRIDLGI